MPYCKEKGRIARDCYKKKRDDAEKEEGNLANQYKENEYYYVTLPEIAHRYIMISTNLIGGSILVHLKI